MGAIHSTRTSEQTGPWPAVSGLRTCTQPRLLGSMRGRTGCLLVELGGCSGRLDPGLRAVSSERLVLVMPGSGHAGPCSTPSPVLVGSLHHPHEAEQEMVGQSRGLAWVSLLPTLLFPFHRCKDRGWGRW